MPAIGLRPSNLPAASGSAIYEQENRLLRTDSGLVAKAMLRPMELR
jgi:hypothetical protein